MPTIAAWPSRIKAGKVVNTPSMLSDWMPTFADVAHIPAPARTDGVSLLPSLTGIGKQKQGLVYVEYFEGGKTPDFKEFEASKRGRKRDQMQAIRLGDLVGVRYAIKTADDDFEIYNAISDLKEITNLATRPGYAKIQEAMKAKILQLRHPDAEAPRPYDNEPIPADKVAAKLLPGLSWKYYAGKFPWVAKMDGLVSTIKGTSQMVNGTEAGSKQGMVCYQGFIKIPVDGHYTFSLQASGKAYLRLHEATLIDADFGYQQGTVLTQEVNLKAGAHAITLYYLLPEGGTPQVTLKCIGQDGIDIGGKDKVFGR
jgi:hypothetical protein